MAPKALEITLEKMNETYDKEPPWFDAKHFPASGIKAGDLVLSGDPFMARVSRQSC